jgi:nitroreductase
VGQDTQVDLFEALYTTSGVVGVKPEPVEDEKTKKILDAAMRAPSSGNSQPWQFIVVRDPKIKASIQSLAIEGMNQYFALREAVGWPKLPKIEKMARRFANETEKVPVLIFVCVDNERTKAKVTLSALGLVLKNPNIRRLGPLGVYASVFPAMQNLLLAARGLGLATRISFFPLFPKGKAASILRLPKYVEPVAVVYLGYPDGPFVRTRRMPSEQSIHYDGW